MADMNYELAPQLGMPASQRKAQLDQARYVAVRNLAHLVYKKPDGTSLMTFGETLDDRERVKATIIGHEISLGYLVNDGMPAPAGVAQQPPVQAPIQVPQQAAPQMTPAAAVPGNGAYQQPQMAVPPPASPQAAAVVGQGGGPTPEPPAPAGRARRGRVGAGVAPVPPAPQEAQPTPQPVSQAAPAAFMAPTQPQPSYGAPAAFVPPSAPIQGGMPAQLAPAPQQVATGDLGQVLAKLDALGQGLSGIAKDGEDLKAQNAELRRTIRLLFAAVHHLYSVDPTLKAGNVPGTLPDFEAYLSRFVNPQ